MNIAGTGLMMVGYALAGTVCGVGLYMLGNLAVIAFRETIGYKLEMRRIAKLERSMMDEHGIPYPSKGA